MPYGSTAAQEAEALQMKELAAEIATRLAGVEPARSKELLSSFVTELFLAVAEEDRRADRRRRQAEGIAAAKAKGVRFGRPAPPLPEGFDSCRQAWREGRMSLRQAARACGMPASTFHDAVVRQERAAG